MKLRPPNLTRNCSTMSPGNPFILKSKGQRSRSLGTNNSAGVSFSTLVSAGFFKLGENLVWDDTKDVRTLIGVGNFGEVAEAGVDDRLGADSDGVGGVRLEAGHLGDGVRTDVDAAPLVHGGRQRQLAVVDPVAGDAVVR